MAVALFILAIDLFVEAYKTIVMKKSVSKEGKSV